MRLLLPSSPLLLRHDRFDILDAPDLEVPFWLILEAVLKGRVTAIAALIEQLETIAVTLRGTARTDYGFLRSFFERHWAGREHFFERVWPAIVGLALEMPGLFPDGALNCLTAENPRATFSRRQVACLVVHQFLCSLPAQPWVTDGSVDFHIWFSSGIPSPLAAQGYLHALFTYFERLADELEGRSPASILGSAGKEWPITFLLRQLHPGEAHLDGLHGNRLLPLQISKLPEASNEPSFLGLPRGACVISANKNVGFGSSGTQEETHVGSSPEACPAVLITPTLKETEVLIIEGAEAMISMKGYGRQARLDKVLESDPGCVDTMQNPWRWRTMLFMDALELDAFDPAELLPDLLPGHVDREIVKAYTAFSSRVSNPESYAKVSTGLWGCGAFGGNWQVKTLIQWCAASMSNVPLHFICAGDRQEPIATRLESLSQKVLAQEWKVGDVLRILRAVDARSVDARDVFAHIENALNSAS